MTIRTLFVDGAYSHSDWPITGGIVRELLSASPRFEVSHVSAPDPAAFRHDFAGYDLIVPFYSPVPNEQGEPLWPEPTRKSFEDRVAAGTGLLIVHATSNGFARWPAFNEMIALGGWGGRDPSQGRCAYVDDSGELVFSEEPGPAGEHEPEHEYVVRCYSPEHPVMRGLPPAWLHCQDEAYARLRGPAVNLEVLATVFAGKTPQGSQRNEPAAMAIRYFEGRVFHTTLGHAEVSLRCAGLQTLLLRGAEWAATGEVTQPVPADFPTLEQTRSRAPVR